MLDNSTINTDMRFRLEGECMRAVETIQKAHPRAVGACVLTDSGALRR